MTTDRLIVVGKALKPVGLKGELKIYPYTESPETFKKFPYLFFESQCLKVRSIRKYKKLIAVFLNGIANYEDAIKLSGKLVRASAQFFTSKEDDEYYWFELINMPVFDIEGKRLGQVHSLMRTSAYDVLQVQTKTKELLIPLVDQIVKMIDLEGNCIVVDLFTGMNPDD